MPEIVQATSQPCPSCKDFKDKKCITCFGLGIVHEGVYCEFCGRSAQFECKGAIVCGSLVCETEANKGSTSKSIEDNDEYLKQYYGLLM